MKHIRKAYGIGGYWHENSSPVVFLLNWGNRYYFLAFICEIFPRLDEINYSWLLGGKVSKEINIQNGFHKPDEKLLNSVVYNHTRTWHFNFMLRRISAVIRDWKTAKNLYDVFFANIREKRMTGKTKAWHKSKRKRLYLFNQGRSNTWWSNLMQGISHLEFSKKN